MRAVAFALVLMLAPVTALACQPAAPHLEQIAQSGMPFESLAGEEAERAAAAFREHIDFQEAPTRIVVVFHGPAAAIWLIVGDKLCSIITGPTEGVREIVKQSRGQGT